MAELVKWVAKMVFRFGVVLAAITTLVIFVNLAFSFVSISLNQTVLGDLIALVQMWLPFNLNHVFIWLFSVTTAYVAYRLAVLSVNYLNVFIGRG